MPKRSKPRTAEEELQHLKKKMRKLEKKMGNATSELCSTIDDGEKAATPAIEQSDWIPELTDDGEPESVIGISEIQIPTEDDCIETPFETPVESELQPQVLSTDKDNELDIDVLEILGEDPSLAEKLGKDIRHELSCRLTHTTTEGLSKEIRKELIAKYPIPANCPRIGAPKLNPEIKVAILENVLKRDKGIEAKQIQMASAISCLGEIINSQLNSKEKDKEKLVKLMDLSRLLCDIQHADSAIRRNFVLFSLKKDLKEHLNNTKIDSFLFGETLAETLKTAKSINKSGVELKADPPSRNTPKRSKVQNHLNRKAPGPAAYRQPGPLQRSYEPAALRRPPPPPPPPTHSSRQWPRQHQQPPPPPPPAQTQGRRRY